MPPSLFINDIISVRMADNLAEQRGLVLQQLVRRAKLADDAIVHDKDLRKRLEHWQTQSNAVIV